MGFQVYRRLIFVCVLFSASAIFCWDDNDAVGQEDSVVEATSTSINILNKCLPHIGAVSKIGLFCLLMANVPAVEAITTEIYSNSSVSVPSIEHVVETVMPLVQFMLPKWPNFIYGNGAMAPSVGWQLSPSGFNAPPAGL